MEIFPDLDPDPHYNRRGFETLAKMRYLLQIMYKDCNIIHCLAIVQVEDKCRLWYVGGGGWRVVKQCWSRVFIPYFFINQKLGTKANICSSVILQAFHSGFDDRLSAQEKHLHGDFPSIQENHNEDAQHGALLLSAAGLWTFPLCVDSTK